jgi:hypothetical protein
MESFKSITIVLLSLVIANSINYGAKTGLMTISYMTDHRISIGIN